MTGRALAAIVTSRLHGERRTTAFACVTAAIVGFIQPHGVTAVADPLTADVATRSVWLAGPIFFCTAIGIALALAQGPGRHPYLDIGERSAPLFGRELARAKAIAPTLTATVAALFYWFAQFLSGFAAPPTFFILALASVLASTLVALNATLRSGGRRLLYVLLAFVTSAIAYVLAVYADSAASRAGDVLGVATELVFCAIVGFIALRQYGEALARSDVVSS
ncbi:MAG: hypothetical protein JO322_06000 [Candidatus Eremiobacteraeota bacterium]|nr:hypothetical protein [Candidatus Eremiobacteraeota bacterium]